MNDESTIAKPSPRNFFPIDLPARRSASGLSSKNEPPVALTEARHQSETCEMNIFDHTARSKLPLRSVVSAAAVVLLAIVFLFKGFGAERGLAATQQATAINEETAKLIVKPRTIELVSEKAMRFRKAIRQGDFSTADQITADVFANSHLQNWRFYPFSNFVSGVSDVSDPEFETHLDRWVARNMNDATPLLMRARYYLDRGWFKRGDHFSRETQAVDMAAFERDMKKASADIDASIHLNDQNPYSF
jgi:hypothetical protein